MEVGRHMEMRQKKRQWPSDTQRAGGWGGVGAGIGREIKAKRWKKEETMMDL